MVVNVQNRPAPKITGRTISFRWVAMGCLTMIVAVGYWSSWQSPFLFDDAGAISNNPTIRRLASWAVLNPPADGSTTTNRPVVNVSFAFNHAISGTDVWSYHALNVAIHLAAALTVMGIARRTFVTPVLRERFGEMAPVLALVTAALWAAHPLQTESVICIAQRTESLCGLFYLLTLYGFIRAVEAGVKGGGWRVVSIVSCLLGMGTKEVMVTAPLIVALYDRAFLAGSFSAAWRQRASYYFALSGTWLLLGWLLLHGGGGRGASAGFGLGVTGWNYLLKQADALCLYLKLAFWPQPLVLDYGTAVATSVVDVWWQACVVVTLLAGTLWALARKPAVGFVGAWFFVILAPSSSVVPLVSQTVAEHRMYLPLAGVISLVVAASYAGSRRWAVPVLSGVAVVFVALTALRAQDFRDELTLWTDTVKKQPENPRAHNNLGLALQSQGRAAQANHHFAEAIQLQADYVSAHYNWGVALLDQGRVEEAVTQFETVTRLAPRHADAHLNLGNALMRLERPTEAIARYEAVLRMNSAAADARQNLEVALAAASRRGLQLARAGKLDEAAEQFRVILRLAPKDADAHANLGNILLFSGDARGAMACYDEALRLRPGDARVRENLQVAREAIAAKSR